MSLRFFPSWLGNHFRRKVNARSPAVRLFVEQLEDRTLPSSYTAASVTELIADINAANRAGGSNSITLVAGKTFTLTTVNNTADDSTGLPVIAANDNLAIVGNGDTIERNTAAATPAFRLFDVAAGASLTLTNLTLQGGRTWTSGGAILNRGNLNLSAVTVQNNVAQGFTTYGASPVGHGTPAAGGAIYTSGLLTALDSIIRNNQALGGQGGDAGYGTFGGQGGDAFGGGIYVVVGTVTLTRVTVSSNSAQGGNGGRGGSQLNNWDRGGFPGGDGGRAFGGGLYVGGGTVTLTDDSVVRNVAQGGAGGHGGHGKPNGAQGHPGFGQGGGLDVDPAALVYIDLFTRANIKQNHASTSDSDSAGPTILI
jgi:hypothetical protein